MSESSQMNWALQEEKKDVQAGDKRGSLGEV